MVFTVMEWSGVSMGRALLARVTHVRILLLLTVMRTRISVMSAPMQTIVWIIRIAQGQRCVHRGNAYPVETRVPKQKAPFAMRW